MITTTLYNRIFASSMCFISISQLTEKYEYFVGSAESEKKVDTLNTNKASTTKNNGEYKKPFKIWAETFFQGQWWGANCLKAKMTSQKPPKDIDR